MEASATRPLPITDGFRRRDDGVDGRQCQLLEIGGVGHRHVGAGDLDRRRIEMVEGVKRNARQISEPIEQTGQPSSTVTMRLVFFTDAITVSMSSGRSVRRSTTSASIPSSARRVAASSA